MSAADLPRPSLTWRGVAPFMLLAAVLVGLWLAGLGDLVSMESLREHRARLQAYTAEHPWLSLLGYVAVYVVAVMLSIPGALLLTLAGGMLFGAWQGGVAAAIGATSGATVTFLLARTGLGEALRARCGPLLTRIIQGFERDAGGYLLTLRLIPLLPFFAVNLAAGVVRMRRRTFVLVTLIGTLPGSLIYASIGSTFVTLFAQGRTPSLDMVLNWRVLAPLFGLSALALASVLLRTWLGRRRRA